MASNSLRVVPSNFTSESEKHSFAETNNSFKVHDTLRHGFKSVASEVTAGHPLEAKLNNWEETQTNLKLNMQRQLYGIHAPVRVLMERDIVSRNQRLPVLPSSNIGLDILTGKDEHVDFEDYLNDPAMSTQMMDVHASMEHKLGMRF
ncbi:proteasome maturation factor UMP1 [Basidiobolus meristosporus CBS 931.73]|uniref:Proteasome maturation factor UMP1 n=1 Tax=Basidiobolus meristosporus CBS 931.73 TaxID=1314790 RepID=A0A1Y1Z5T1_9FUNG|nr:proteasome maturation factor UMP1 [Basidiobolus meristosporus CBS 931.73]|eukprot:ORY05642.1 proteasome maturation factor UMP1 [Basidiobolus meristosporus CBS 931.73]